jgi:hypothetical protein
MTVAPGWILSVPGGDGSAPTLRALYVCVVPDGTVTVPVIVCASADRIAPINSAVVEAVANSAPRHDGIIAARLGAIDAAASADPCDRCGALPFDFVPNRPTPR